MIALIDGEVRAVKYCSKCQTNKLIVEFGKLHNGPGGLAYWCKECNKANGKRHHAENKHKPEYRAKRREQHFKREYSITIKEHQQLWREQGKVCKICSNKIPSQGTHIHVDHDHKTGKIRGLLCTNCNRGLGHFQDNLENLEAAINYLKESGPSVGDLK